jgi:hypothetical protein
MWKSNFAGVEHNIGNRLDRKGYGIYLSPSFGTEAEFSWIGMLIAIL